ncbi:MULTISPECIES: LPS translocon maturation chaperone LptM [Photobacterium]|uniref:Lipopeptide n=1 Tax=Photobacterium halotolerans TaxID=265726 RepID=A0A0F5V9B7_9GAMM|nr:MULTISPECIES: lipoprotein [Photobacterium]KKC98657.1 lipopeptide [Photobacterium halotolerans]NAW66403.1 lipopeptide [Photobacterium halotolerans]NAW88702.1 lipopeptide [Photobacterium halotolerans]NAX47287.1 lipopeptide [Photobacterium halotolerans]
MRTGLIATFILTVLTLAGCGQSGPLYMPADDTEQAEQTE